MNVSMTGAGSDLLALARSALEAGQAAIACRDIDNALRWLDRAHRLVPRDPNVALTLATAFLERDPGRAEDLFLSITDDYDVKQAWLGLAAARLLRDGPHAALTALHTALSRHAFRAEDAVLAERVAGPTGWCGLRSDGTLEVHASGKIHILQDGLTLTGAKLDDGWATSRSVTIHSDGMPLLGSPIEPGAIRRIEGCVEVTDSGIQGWAWHPADPDTDPELTIRWQRTGESRKFIANDESAVVPDTGPLARPRVFGLTAQQIGLDSGPIFIEGPDGRSLLGSPLDPYAEKYELVQAALSLGKRYAAEATHSTVTDTALASLRVDTTRPGRPIGAEGRKRGVMIVIPVHNGTSVALNCLASVRASLPIGAKLLVVDDGSTEPALVSLLNELAASRQIKLLRNKLAQGFPASANAGIRASRGRDVVLLNSDTIVPPRWLDRLRDAAYSALDIGTVTPLSNDGSILSYPGEAGSNPRPNQRDTNRIDRLANQANKDRIVDIPVGVGFCLYLRRDCLNSVGLFRDDVFAQGYGEENDLCLRAQLLGWRNVALTGLFVGHAGGATFGTSTKHLRARNGKIIERLHPGYDKLISDFIALDPLAAVRRRIDSLRWRDACRGRQTSVILITHDEGGGVEDRVAESARAHDRAGRRPVILRPSRKPLPGSAIVVSDGISDEFPNLVYVLPNDMSELARLLRACRPEAIEVHHFLHHGSAIYDLIRQLKTPYDVYIHDYMWFCPRIALVRQERYCGEPAVHVCEACIVDHGHFLSEQIALVDMRARSAKFLSGARTVIAPSADAAIRMKRHFPAIAIQIAEHEDDHLIAPAPRAAPANQRRRVCVMGAIGLHKGYDVLLACARDAQQRDLSLEFVVVGHTIDDARMMATGRVFVTGPYHSQEAVQLVVSQRADLGFIASIWPETWCLTLSEIWRAGLSAAAFDIGAPAERIRRTGRGFLLPLGLSADAINNELVAAITRQG